jgi:hypothetical protein
MSYRIDVDEVVIEATRRIVDEQVDSRAPSIMSPPPTASASSFSEDRGESGARLETSP